MSFVVDDLLGWLIGLLADKGLANLWPRKPTCVP